MSMTIASKQADASRQAQLSGAAPTADEVATDLALMEAIRGGDHQAFAQLYDRHAAQIYTLCLRVLHRDSEAEAVVSDVFWEIWQKPAGFDATRGSCRTYLLTVARSRAIDRWRASATRSRKTEDAGKASAEQTLDDQLREDPAQRALASERQQAVRQEIQRLESRQRDALQLAYFEGLTHREIAEQLELPLGTVKTHIRNGLRILRSALKSLGDSDGMQ
ncbi:MAG: sigma-70 family RNA polymerase sigma factor [Bythopirellula sp.]